MARGSKSTQRRTTSAQVHDTNPDPDLPLGLVTNNPVLERIGIGPEDARVTIEVNQYKYTDVPLAAMHMEDLTRDDLADAIRAWRTKKQVPPEPE